MEIDIESSPDVRGRFDPSLFEGTIAEFEGLSSIYSKITVLAASEDAIKKGFFEHQEKRIFGEPIIPLTGQTQSLSSSGSPPEGCIKVNLDRFDSFPHWKQMLAIRHECCHLLRASLSSRTLGRLLKVYSFEYLRDIIRYRREFVAHICILKQYPSDWLREPVRIPKTIGSPRTFYRKIKKENGVRAAVEVAISNSIKILSLIYIYEVLAENIVVPAELTKDLQRYKSYLGSWWYQVSKDTDSRIPVVSDVIRVEDFEDEEIFFQKVEGLLNQVGTMFPRKNIQPVTISPGIVFSHVAVGGKDSWGSESMKKIMASRKSDVKTVIGFSLPFSLLRLPDGSYEMKEDDYAYRFVVNRTRRQPEIAHRLTGWTPEGNIDILGDRFGRFSNSRVEVHFPYRIDEDMWDYSCPNCELEIDESTTTCPICGARFSSEKSRRPSLRKVKKRAIGLTNKFLDAYRFFFKDYFVEHIRYNDVIAYEIEYVMDGGTKASWSESFSLGVGSTVETGSLTARPDEIESFSKILSDLDENIALRDYLLASAENRISTEEYRLAILEAIVAFEGVLSEYVLTKGYHLIMSQNPKLKKNERYSDAKRYNRWRFLTPKTEDVWGVISGRIEQADPSVLIGCKWAINKRNDIVHDQLLDVRYNDAKKTLWYIKSMIEYIKQS